MNHLRVSTAIALTLLLAGVALGAQRRMPVEMLCEHSERIVIGKVTASHNTTAEWPGLGPLLTTVFTIDVETSWKGSTVDTLEVQVPGGIDWEKAEGVHVSGAPRLRIGEKVLLFLDETDDGVVRVYGMQQGKYEVVVSRVVGGSGLPIDEDILLAPLKTRIDAILAAQAKSRAAEEPESTEGGNR